MENLRLIVAILAGGQSRRMGNDKAELKQNGVSLLEKTCRVALQNGERTIVVGREMPRDWTTENVLFLRDETPQVGPLGGLKTALRWAQNENFDAVFALPCDLPLLRADALNWLKNQTENCNAHGLVARNGEQIEPLFSIYCVSCFPLIETQLAQSKRSLHALIERGDFGFIEVPDEIALQLTNVNTPQEWAQIGESSTRREL